jgi:hypothetical protein
MRHDTEQGFVQKPTGAQAALSGATTSRYDRRNCLKNTADKRGPDA